MVGQLSTISVERIVPTVTPHVLREEAAFVFSPDSAAQVSDKLSCVPWKHIESTLDDSFLILHTHTHTHTHTSACEDPHVAQDSTGQHGKAVL